VGRCPTILINRRAVLAKLLAILALVIVAKFLIGTGIVKLFGYPLKTAALVGTGLTQIGEFSFILVQVAHTNALAEMSFITPFWPRP
jgi:K+:H+ antiporter